MPSAEIVALRDRPALTSSPLAGTEKLIADNGTADGLVTVAQLSAAARVGVRLAADPVALADVTDLVSSLAAKADAGAMPANLAADSLTLTKRDTAPAAPGSGKCTLWVGPGDNPGEFALMATCGVQGNATTLFKPIAAPEWADDPFWTNKLLPIGGTGDDGDGYTFAIGEYSESFGSSSVTGSRFSLSVDSTISGPTVVEQQDTGGGWHVVGGANGLLNAGTPFVVESDPARRGLFRLKFDTEFQLSDPAPTVTVTLQTPN